MNFVADESCAGPVIRALREAGHDVIAIAEVAKGATDEQVLARGRSTAGVLLVRFRSRARRAKPATVVEAVAKLGSRLQGAFAVVEPGRVRLTGRPPQP